MDASELKKRTGWAINRVVADDRSLNNITLSPLLDSNPTTISNYRTMKNAPKVAFIIKFCEIFGYNLNWFMTGEGEPFPGAHKKYPEVCGSIISITVREEMADYGQNTSHLLFSSDQKINIEEAMGKTYKILSAGSALSVALYMNIQQFAAALDTGHALSLCQDQMKEMQAQIDALNRKVDGLTSRPITAEGQGDGSDKEAM